MKTADLKEYQRKYRAENRDRMKLLQKRWYESRRNRVRERVRKLGLDSAVADIIMSMPQLCNICGEPPKIKDLHIDHDHLTLEFRGLLCHSCNVGIGHFRESPDLLDKAKRYISRFVFSEKIPRENRFNQ